MSTARIRKCPHCYTSFIRVDGCNKMTCNRCGVMSCYICRARVQGTDHFGQGPNACPLYSPVPELTDRPNVKQAGAKSVARLSKTVTGELDGLVGKLI
jgi:hypothetical protein